MPSSFSWEISPSYLYICTRVLIIWAMLAKLLLDVAFTENIQQ